jgi:predicted kinase
MTQSRVVLMCGPAGSGKTTFSKQLESQGYARLSIDEEIWKRLESGLLTPDSDIHMVSLSIEEDIRARLVHMVRHGQNVVVDFSFWQRSIRDAYRRIVTENGGQVELVYFRVPPHVLQERAARRNDANDVSAGKMTLDRFISGFEEPGEDEHPIVIDNLSGMHDETG